MKTDITQSGLTELLRIATKDQLFQFDGQLYEQVDGVAMGSPLGPLMANVFLCSIEEQLDRNNKLPSFYKRYVDDTLATMPNIQAATAFLSTLNECHPAIQFTITSNASHIASQIPYVNQRLLSKWLPEDTKKCMGSEIKSYFLAV